MNEASPGISSPISVLLALLALGSIPPTSVNAQALAGTVLDENSRQPIRTVFVQLLDSGGRAVAASMTDSLGTFLIISPQPGEFRVRLQGLGYQAQEAGPFRISGNMQRTFLLPPDPITIPGLVAEGAHHCVLEAEQAQETAEAWEKIREAILPTAFLNEERALRYDVVRFTRHIDPDSTAIRNEQGWRFELTQPFRTLPPDSLLAGGLVREEGDTLIFHMPDLSALLSSEFLNSHCFGFVGETGSGSVAGLRFVPSPGASRDRAGQEMGSALRGVFWIERESGTPLSVDYEYLWGDEDRFRPTAHAEFTRLLGGLWIIRDWTISMPRLRDRSWLFGLFKSTEVVEIVEDGGHLVSVRTQEGFQLGEEDLAGLRGEVWDSIHGGPLVDAVVRISGTDRMTTTDSMGRFEIPGVRRGEYLVAFSHPLLDTLRVPDPSRFVPVPSSTPTLLAVPSRPTVLRSVCPDQRPDWDRGVLWGRVRDHRGPLPGVSIRVGFGEVRIGQNQIRTSGGETITDASGAFSVCAVPPREMAIEASIGNRSRVFRVRMPEYGFVRFDLDLSDVRSPGKGRPGNDHLPNS